MGCARQQERSSIFETRVERAALCRDRGSARFREKDLVGAIAWYERALFHVDFDEGTWHFEVAFYGLEHVLYWWIDAHSLSVHYASSWTSTATP